MIIQILPYAGYGSNAAAVADTGICSGASITLASPRAGATSYLWSTGATGNSITVSPGSTTIYWVDATLSNNTVRDSFTVHVELQAAPPVIKTDTAFLIATSCNGCSIKWYRNNEFLKKTPDTLFFPLEGVYYGKLSYGSYCWSVSSNYIYVANDRDTATLAFKKTLFPNPSNGYFNIDLVFPRMVSSVIKVTVASIDGTLLYQSAPFFYRTSASRIPVRLPAGFRGQAAVQLSMPGRAALTEKIIVQ